MLDRRPPHYRCPAVPGLKSPARAILTVPGSSVLPSAISYYQAGTTHRTPLPDFPVRAPEAGAFTGVLLTDFAAARQFIPAKPTVFLATRKPYPRNGRMSTLANIDFPRFKAEVICSESRGRDPPPRKPGPGRPGGEHAHTPDAFRQLPAGRAKDPGQRAGKGPLATHVPTRAKNRSAPARCRGRRIGEGAGQMAEDRGFEPRMGSLPNRISSAAP